MKILFTNDDGYAAIGIQTLYKAFMSDFDAYMCAPLHHKSGFGHAINYSDYVDIVPLQAPFRGYALDSTPADCSRAAMLDLFDMKFDLVISGINYGVNIAQDVFYSGTIGAAREATFHGLPAVAVSLEVEDHNYNGIMHVNIEKLFIYAAGILKKIVESFPQDVLNYRGSVINVNFPSIMPAKGIKIVELGNHIYNTTLLYNQNKTKVKIDSVNRSTVSPPSTDTYELNQGYIVVTALKNGAVLDPVLQEKLLFLEQMTME